MCPSRRSQSGWSSTASDRLGDGRLDDAPRRPRRRPGGAASSPRSRSPWYGSESSVSGSAVPCTSAVPSAGPPAPPWSRPRAARPGRRRRTRIRRVQRGRARASAIRTGAVRASPARPRPAGGSGRGSRCASWSPAPRPARPRGRPARSASATTARPTAAVLLRPSAPRGKTTPCGWCCSSVLIGPSCPPRVPALPHPAVTRGYGPRGRGVPHGNGPHPRASAFGVRRGPGSRILPGCTRGMPRSASCSNGSSASSRTSARPDDATSSGRHASAAGCRGRAGCSPGSSC